MVRLGGQVEPEENNDQEEEIIASDALLWCITLIQSETFTRKEELSDLVPMFKIWGRVSTKYQ